MVKPIDEREHAFFSARFSRIHFFGKYGKTTVKSRIPRVNSSERFFSFKTAAKCRNTVAVKAFIPSVNRLMNVSKQTKTS